MIGHAECRENVDRETAMLLPPLPPLLSKPRAESERLLAYSDMEGGMDKKRSFAVGLIAGHRLPAFLGVLLLLTPPFVFCQQDQPKLLDLLGTSKDEKEELSKEIKEENRDLLYARGNVDDAIYLVTKWTRQNLTGGLKTFQKTADPSGLSNIDPKTLSNLPPDVRSGLMKQIEEKKRQQQLIEKFQRQAEKKAKKEAAVSKSD